MTSRSGEVEVHRAAHLNAFPITLPNFATLLLVFLSLDFLVPLRILVLLALLMQTEGGFQVPCEPSVETRIICMFQGGAL